ncbi:DUF305 domain-containing protein [Nocardiopsis ansamitocini]|uniref:Lipoprotein n=1 Tax=Nocardiopsis ansamitocini TaxID=1670832 RepID=A0A9W6UIR0_9ACTN|nr:DUF305 domain-containing protein [Nocardiopsis ansamitocini]GLU47957.1 lipoprotein [Nocardiopsis ansamitocini]
MRRGLTAAIGAAVLGLSCVACTNGGTAADAPPVLAPGAPGESASPATEEQLAAAQDGNGHNEADVTYMVKMIMHHEQAVEMADLVPDRVENAKIRALSDRIDVAQQGELTIMEEWLDVNVYQPARRNPAHQNYCGLGGDHHGDEAGCVELDTDHSDMPGMATPEQMAELESASGAAFDELFVKLMVTHHEGGITMAEDAMIDGRHSQVLQMANDLITDQSLEIERLESALQN